MKKILLLLAAAGAMAAAIPAAAQTFGVYGPPAYGYGYGSSPYGIGYTFTSPSAHIEQRIKRCGILIDRSARQGEISRREANMLFQELRGIAQHEDRYERGGMSRGEFAMLNARLDTLQSHLQQARNSHGGRYGYGYGNGYGYGYGYGDRRW